MIRKTRAEVKREVKIILDQNEEDMELTAIGDSDQLQTDDIIDEVMDLAKDRLYMIAPMDLLMEAAVTLDNVSWDVTSDEYCQCAEMPANMLRLVYVRLDGWDKGASEAIRMTDDKYYEYRSQFAGIRPTRKRPACAIVPEVENSGGEIHSYNKLEAYPNMKDEFGKVVYLPMSDRSDDNIDIPNLCWQAYLYMVANLYYVTLGEQAMADMMANEVKECVGLLNPEDLKR